MTQPSDPTQPQRHPADPRPRAGRPAPAAPGEARQAGARPASYNLGQLGEDLALEYLRNRGYQILETRWRHHHYEIDIIAVDTATDELVSVEVKTRSSNVWGEPENAVDLRKIRRSVLATDAYLRLTQTTRDVRFDIFAIIIPPQGRPTLHHLKNAFYPPLS